MADDLSDLPDFPVIPLPGSEGWVSAYEWGDELAKRFPDQDADDLAYACEYNVYGPARDRQITDVKMLVQGCRDESDWCWEVTFDDGSKWRATGGCDYTGWDCLSWLEWAEAPA